MMVENLMLMMDESVKSKDWLDKLAYVLWEKLLRKFKPFDQVANAEQTTKLLNLKLKKGRDPSKLELKIALIEAMYGIPLSNEMKIAAVMKAAGYECSDTIQCETRMTKKAGGTETYDDLIQAMTQSFRIYRNQSNSDSESDEAKVVVASVGSFREKCNVCEKEGHKAGECPKKKSLTCRNCMKKGHTEEFCWELEKNKSRQPEWWKREEQANASVGIDEVIL
jgi:hypothetical protein